MKARVLAVLATLLVVAAVLVAAVLLRNGDDDPAGAEPGSRPTGAAPTLAPEDRGPDPTVHDPALSRPVEDSYYPNVGDPGVDALHYDLDLDWDRGQRRLDAVATVTFRATRSAPEFRLDLGDPLEVTGVTLDGEEVPHEHNGKDLVVTSPVAVDDRYVLVVEYAGTPAPTRAPGTRPDFQTLGWTVTEAGEVWTMQEPYGAFTWYPVNDQPSDKAFYDFTITAPADWVGVANGELTSRQGVDGRTVTTWHMAAPAPAYLVTIAIGDYVVNETRSRSGVPLSYWTPRGDAETLRRVRFTPQALAWAEGKLGKYPFERLGILVVNGSESGMETQTMITLGNQGEPYTTSPEVLVHEIVHHWYGDTVSPTDWRDVWMNEGMTMYLQGQFEAERTGVPVDVVMDGWASYEAGMRANSGPPGAYDPARFGDGNVYYGPALMWHELRQRIGDDRFWAMARAWPTVRAQGNATRADYLDWVEKHTGEELTAFFAAWLAGPTTPPR